MKNRKSLIVNLQSLIILIMLFTATNALSQIYVAGAPITPDRYILIEVFQKRKHTIAFIDYGRNNIRYLKISTPDGDPKKFKSTVDIFNFLCEQGYEFIEVSGEMLLFRKKESNK